MGGGSLSLRPLSSAFACDRAKHSMSNLKGIRKARAAPHTTSTIVAPWSKWRRVCGSARARPTGRKVAAREHGQDGNGQHNKGAHNLDAQS